MSIQPHWTEKVAHIGKVLASHKVDWLIVGGTAVAFHGYERFSINKAGMPQEVMDLDIWYNPILRNYRRLLIAMEALHLDVSRYKD